MPSTILAASAGSINDTGLGQGISNQVNALLATILDKTFDTFQVSIADTSRTLGNEIAVLLGHKATGAVITNPYKLQVLQASSMAELAGVVQDWIDANPAFWVGPIRMEYAPTMAVSSLAPYFASILYNEDATDGAANWDPMG